MRLRGEGIGTGTVLGTAAVVRVLAGMLMPPEVPLRVLEQRVAGRTNEIPDVIVAAESYEIAVVVVGTLTWANVVGIAAVRLGDNPPFSPLPAVVGIPNLLEVAENDMLLLLDASHGVLLADPDPIAISQYQMEAEHLAPKRRLFLDSAHLPAQTLDGHTIQVIASTPNLQEVYAALHNGADALYIAHEADNAGNFFLPFQSAILPIQADEPSLRKNIFEALAIASGKPIFIADNYELPLILLLEAAGRAEITVALSPRTELTGLGIAEMREELKAALPECEEAGLLCDLPRLAADFTLPLAADKANSDASLTEKLRANGTPILYHVAAQEENADFGAAIRAAVSRGATDFVFPAARVPEAKEIIRRLTYGELRTEESA